jgi:preprotein translocase subunit YajC
VKTYAIVAAEGSPAPAPTEGDEEQRPGGGMTNMLLLMGAIFVVFYLLLIRPQRKKEKDRQRRREEMLANLNRNDHVMTIGGIHGIVASVGEKEVAIKIDERGDVKMRLSRDAISKVVGKDEEEGDAEGEKTLGDRSDGSR